MERYSAATACRFRYIGHHQAGAVRDLAFEDRASGATVHLELDINLLSKHHLHLQDAPNVCAIILGGTRLAAPVLHEGEVIISVTDGDLESIAPTEQSPAPKRRKAKVK